MLTQVPAPGLTSEDLFATFSTVRYSGFGIRGSGFAFGIQSFEDSDQTTNAFNFKLSSTLAFYTALNTI